METKQAWLIESGLKYDADHIGGNISDAKTLNGGDSPTLRMLLVKSKIVLKADDCTIFNRLRSTAAVPFCTVSDSSFSQQHLFFILSHQEE